MSEMISNPPLDEDGKPLALVSYTSKEVIPTAKYANVELRATATKFTDDFQSGFADCCIAVNECLEDERDKVLKELEGAS